jgi:hypothetical protein
MATIEQGKQRLCEYLNDRQNRLLSIDDVLFTLVRFWGFSLKRARTILLEIIDENPDAIVLEGVSAGLIDALNMNGTAGSKRCQSWVIYHRGFKTKIRVLKPLPEERAKVIGNMDKRYAEEMKLPNGMTCADCKHFHRCSWLLSRQENSTHCDW